MAFTPNSRVYLLDTPLDNKQKNQIHFDDIGDQHTYFWGRRKHEYEGVTYQRKDNAFVVNDHIDNLWDSNYVMYQNANFNTKWFYAFILRMEYVNDHATRIFIETDVYQTWLFDVEIKQSFVVREHVSSDNMGEHLVDEGLELGEYVMQEYEPTDKLGAHYNILAVSDNSPLGETALIGNLYGNLVTGLTYFPFPNTDDGITWLKNTIQTYTSAGKADAIIMIFTVPELVVQSWTGELGYPLTTGTPLGADTIEIIKKIDAIDGYVPKNNKMFTYPYKFLYMSNNTGLSAQYRYEDFRESNIMQFQLYGAAMPNPTIRIAPNNYKGITGETNMEYGLSLQGFPMCSWTTDMYAAWFAQNTISTGVALIGSVGAIGAGIATANPVAIGGGALGVAHQLAQIQKASIQPDQAKGNTNGGSIQYCSQTLDFYYSHMSIRAEYAKRIDDFFTMYGYKVNALKVPETKSRRYWNYVQTIDINIEGAIPVEDIVRLKKAYDEGITLWHTTSGFLNYSLDNSL